MEMEDSLYYYNLNYNLPDSDLDLSFTTTTTDRSVSGRSSLARSSLNDSCLSYTSAATPYTSLSSVYHRPHCRHDNPNWAAVMAAKTLSSDGRLHLRHLKLIRPVGAGNLGRVFLCRLRDCENACFALKVVDHKTLSAKKLSQVKMEARILSSLDHPFLPTLYAHIEVSHYSCLLMDYCPNGDLHSLLQKQPGNCLSVRDVRFFAAEILLALEYLHSQGFVYRDLKPENILIREDGHIMLSDFDLCFQSDVEPKLENWTQIKAGSAGYSCLVHRRTEKWVTEFVAEPTAAFSTSCVGTHEYLSPELITGNGHGNGVDWWAFGVLIYELLFGRTPFKGRTKESTLRNISSSRGVKFFVNNEEREDPGMAAARDLIEKLLVKDPRRRLGCHRGSTDIKRHPFFRGIKWPLIRNYRPPEIRGLAVSKRSRSKSHVSGVFSPRRRRFSWKRITDLLRIRLSKYSLNSNYNSYSSTKLE